MQGVSQRLLYCKTTTLRNVKGSNGHAAPYWFQYDLRFSEYYRQDKCAQRLLLTVRPWLSDFCSYQLVSNLLESLNPHRSDEIMKMATTEAAFSSGVRWLSKPMKTHSVAEVCRMTEVCWVLDDRKAIAIQTNFRLWIHRARVKVVENLSHGWLPAWNDILK